MRLAEFRIRNYRNIIDSGPVKVSDVTAFVGQNEAGKSNLFEALYALHPYVPTKYDPNEDWPVDDWKGKKGAEGKIVASAYFAFEEGEAEALFEHAFEAAEDDSDEENVETSEPGRDPPKGLQIYAQRHYGYGTGFYLANEHGGTVDPKGFSLSAEKVKDWASRNVPRFVLIQDYDFSGAQVELNQLKARLDKVGGPANRDQLSADDQTILIVIDLAEIDLQDFVEKGDSAEGRTLRQFDKRAASAYLTKQFQKLWKQKKVKFDIDVDGPTFNIFAEDEAIGFPVRLNRRSTGFRWYVSFAWKFTHASAGEFENCTLLLEEPGIHLHYSGQRDLLTVFEDLSATNRVLYTTHLSSMVDQANPERVRIVETDSNHHLKINHGVVSSQSAPMAVIESALGLTPDLSGMLGNRKVLIVEGGTDTLILNKLSGLLVKGGKTGLSDQVYMWPAQTSTKVPMYAAFAIGQRWEAGALLDTDPAGHDAHKKIKEMGLKAYAEETGHDFRVFMLGEAAGIKKTDAAIEDLFPDDWFLDCVNRAYGVALKIEDLPEDGSTLIAKRVETALRMRHGKTLDKKLVLTEVLSDFDKWKTIKDLPKGVLEKSEKLFKRINSLFEITD
ncbi:ATP-dependent nuclease [Aurantimonas coralicida]|uniref:ATP-dependent nuclease n=1 Tax=Aurantimonas coralicida TaxID=182270 RepID=UPI001E2A612F|nr:AAA family ATPase [Aurantimonas coralicida]MCD1642392.1 AAA family ATPase [Aurantimonas coralicida]